MWMSSLFLGRYMLWFGVLVATFGALAVAAAYLIRPTETKLALMRPLSLASIFSALCSLTAGWAVVLQGAAATPTWTSGSVQRLLMGSAQTLVPVFTTFGILAVSWVLVALGTRRHRILALAVEAGDAYQLPPSPG